jgi:hypothetical protein
MFHSLYSSETEGLIADLPSAHAPCRRWRYRRELRAEIRAEYLRTGRALGKAGLARTLSFSLHFTLATHKSHPYSTGYLEMASRRPKRIIVCCDGTWMDSLGKDG